MLSISHPRPGQPARIAIQTYNRDVTFRIIDLTGPLHKGVFQEVKPFPASTHLEWPGPFAPDGGFAYVSGWRPARIWRSQNDGTGRRQIASVEAADLILDSWSPDGRKILYSASVDGNQDVYVLDVAGGQPSRITIEASIEGSASWSRDGRSIYFGSTRAGSTPDIWRIPAGGGRAVRITYHGGFQPREARDGYLYYLVPNLAEDRADATTKLMRRQIDGGPETMVLSDVTPFRWDIADSGIFYITREQEFDAIDHYRFSDQQVHRVGLLAVRFGQFRSRMSVSPDGHWALVPLHTAQSDLMMIDNFR